MFRIFRVFLLAFFHLLSLGAIAGDRLDDEINRYSKKAFEVRQNESKISDLIKQIDSKLLKKSTKSKERKDLLQQREDNVINKWKSKNNLKKNNRILRHLYSQKLQKMDLKISPKGVCNNPCLITMEAIANKSIKSSVSKYNFYIDEKKIESLTPNVSVTIYFSISMLNDKQRKMLNKNVPLHKVFKLRAEALISEDKMIQSEIKKVVVKSRPSNLTNIELITGAVMPMSKIQIATSGIKTTELTGKIGNQEITFQVDKSTGSSNVFSAIMPYLTSNQVILTIANFQLNVTVVPVVQVSNPINFVQYFSNSSLELSNTIITGPKLAALVGSNGIPIAASFNEVLRAFDNYIKNEATPEEVQQIANLINASMISDKNIFYFVKNTQNSKDFTNQAITNNRLPKEVLSKIFGLIIQDSYAQADQSNLLKKILMDKLNASIEFVLTVGFTTLFDGMINKCYISKGRQVPSDVTFNELWLNRLFKSSAVGLIAGTYPGIAGYISTIAGADALIIRIGLDCKGDSTIDPKLVINSQPTFPIVPGESINYNVKCDVGDERYYAPNSLPIKVSSRFDYKVPSFVDAGVSTSADKLLNGCSGLGQEVIKNEHDILCTTNQLKDTQFYQDNIDQYETFSPAACNGVDSYDAGINLVISPSLSCNFVNSDEGVNIIGESVNGNQLVFDLTKTWKCPSKPHAVINYTKNNFAVKFDSTDPQNPSVTGLTYSWNFGDGQTASTTSKIFSHTYAQGGSYSVSLTIKDEFGSIDTETVTVILSGKIFPTKALCEQHYDEAHGYYSYYGRVFGIGFKYNGNGDLTSNMSRRSGTIGDLLYPDLEWFWVDTNESSTRIIISDPSGVIFDQFVTNPCVQGMSLPEDSIISI